jgi:hypothetical protein
MTYIYYIYFNFYKNNNLLLNDDVLLEKIYERKVMGNVI